MPWILAFTALVSSLAAGFWIIRRYCRSVVSCISATLVLGTLCFPAAVMALWCLDFNELNDACEASSEVVAATGSGLFLGLGALALFTAVRAVWFGSRTSFRPGGVPNVTLPDGTAVTDAVGNPIFPLP